MHFLPEHSAAPCPPLTRARALALGARDTLPLIAGTIPFGLICGTLAVAAGLSAAQAVGMSMLVFAGSAQFIAISLLASGAGVAVVILTTLVVNLRHVLYSATLQPHVRHLPQRWRAPLAFWLNDETFAVVHRWYDAAGAQREQGREGNAVPSAATLSSMPSSCATSHWYYCGSGMAMYVNWVLCTLLGVMFGQRIPNLAGWGLDFAMLATFIGIIVPLLRNRPQVAAAAVAACVALAAQGLPYKLGLMAAAVAGIAAGVSLERGTGRNRAHPT